ncbi:MAG: HK97 gp10 family phage protein [Clostridia bacterium]|nr:HK97 gp10 family phage protein [Clostridia bacterium]
MTRMGNCDFSELRKFAKHLEKQEAKAKAMIERCINDLVAEMLARTKDRTPVDSGDLRRAWTVSSIKRIGKYYKIVISNNLEYGAYVEYGHRTSNHKGWVPGKFMMTVSAKEIDSLAPAVIERRIKAFLNQVMQYDK